MLHPSEPLAISVAILAGGRGRRLGHEKVQLELGGQTLLMRVLKAVDPLSDDIMVITRGDPSLGDVSGSLSQGVRLLHDRAGARGVLAGMATGLEAARHNWLLVVGADMPFISGKLVSYLCSQCCGHDLVVPRLHVGLEPLHALYHRNCLPAVEQALQKGERRVASFFDTLNVRYLDPAEMAPFDPKQRSFFNINTPQDLSLARQWLEEPECRPVEVL